MTGINRRRFVGQSTTVLTGAGLATALGVPAVHAAGDDIIRVGLIGCGGRGAGAASQALLADKGVQLTAFGDLFEHRLAGSRKALKDRYGDRVSASDDNCFVGFDAYKKVIDSGVDVVLLATPPAFRPLQIQAAIAAGKHLFAEKPMAVDAPGVRSVLESSQEAKRKGLSIVSGLMLRYDPSMQATVHRVLDGAVGNIVALECNSNIPGLWVQKRREDWSDMEYQIRNWLYFTWTSGDLIVEYHIHVLDLIAWAMQEQYPVSAVGQGGRQQRTGSEYGHIFDHFAIRFEYANGARCYSYARQQANTATDDSTSVFGAEGTAHLMRRAITGATPWRYQGAGTRGYKEGEQGGFKGIWGGYQETHDALFASVRSGKPINDGESMAKSTLMSIMGRMAAYTGRVITWDMALNSKEVLTPAEYKFGPLPTAPVAVPGMTEFS